MNSPHSLREVFVCLDAPINRTPLQAFACSPLGRYDRPPFQACDLRSYATTARLSRRSFSAFPVYARPPCRRSTSDGVGFGANDRPSASAFGRSLWSALPPSAPWVVFCLRFAPTMSEKKIAKGFAFHNFFLRQNTTFQTNYTIFAL